MKKYTHYYLIVLVSYLMVSIATLFEGGKCAFAIEPTSNMAKQDISHSKLSPMAEKHIFSPEPDTLGVNNLITPDGKSTNSGKVDGAQQSIDLLIEKVKMEIELTGIIITPESKRAMILYKGKGEKRQVPALYGSGASIDDYLLKEIFPNYVVISQNNLEVKVGLFKERNDRPEIPKEGKPQNNAATALNGQELPKSKDMNKAEETDGNSAVKRVSAPPNTLRPIPRNIQNGNATDSSNPFARAMQDDASSGTSDNTTNFNNSSTDGTNPFLQAIKRARERQQSQ